MDLLVKGIARDEPVLMFSVVNTMTVEKARTIHDTFPTATVALGRTMTGALLMSSMLKRDQKISLQVVGEGPLKEVYAEADWLGRVRGYVRRPHVHMGLRGDNLDVGRAIGKGFLHVVKDLGLREPYHGSVSLQTGEVASDLAYYLLVSEQVPAAVSAGVFVDTDNSVRASGGFMIHALPEAGDDLLRYLEDRVRNLRPVSSLVLDGMEAEEIIDEVLDMPFGVLETRDVYYFCPCSKQRMMASLITLGEKDIREIIDKGEPCLIQCHFCSTEYNVSTHELLSLLNEMTSAT